MENKILFESFLDVLILQYILLDLLELHSFSR